jgi:hypothetical protein
MSLKYSSRDVKLITLNFYTKHIQTIRQPLFADSAPIEYPDHSDISHCRISTLLKISFYVHKKFTAQR